VYSKSSNKGAFIRSDGLGQGAGDDREIFVAANVLKCCNAMHIASGDKVEFTERPSFSKT
jgi:hypothetical protein